MRGNPFVPSGAPTPVLNGVTPVFVEHGADPRIAPGVDLPIGSILRFGTAYFQKYGPLATDWAAFAAPVAAGGDWYRSLRPSDPGTPFVSQASHIDFAGRSWASAGTTNTGLGTAALYNGLAALDRYFAIPEYYPVAGVIRRISWFAQAATLNVNGRMQLHLYSNGVGTGPFAGWPFPDELLISGTLFQPAFEGALLAPGVFNIYDTILPTPLPVAAGTILWHVFRANAQMMSGTLMSIARGLMPPWMGFRIGAAALSSDSATLGYGYETLHVFTDGAADPFPSSASILTIGADPTQTTAPAIGYGFSPT